MAERTTSTIHVSYPLPGRPLPGRRSRVKANIVRTNVDGSASRLLPPGTSHLLPQKPPVATPSKAKVSKGEVPEIKVFERKGPFRFLDFPPELRNNVYRFALSRQGKEAGSRPDNTSRTPSPTNAISAALPKHDKYNIATFKPPPLTLVSKQVRQESLAHFFSENNFFLTVVSNYEHKDLLSNGGSYGRRKQMKDEKSRCGTLGFKQLVRTFMKTAGESTVFKDVTFKVMKVAHPFWIKEARYREISVGRVAEIRLVIAADLTLQNDTMFVPNRLAVGVPAGGDSLVEVCRKAVGVASDMTAREGFKGFTLRDLSNIARALRYEW